MDGWVDGSEDGHPHWCETSRWVPTSSVPSTAPPDPLIQFPNLIGTFSPGLPICTNLGPFSGTKEAHLEQQREVWQENQDPQFPIPALFCVAKQLFRLLCVSFHPHYEHSASFVLRCVDGTCAAAIKDPPGATRARVSFISASWSTDSFTPGNSYPAFKIQLRHRF